MTKKRFLLSGYFGFKNFGDEAILSVIVSRLKLFGHKVTIITSDNEYTKSKFKYVRTVKMFSLSDIVFSMFKTDFLISGGGSLLQDTTSLKSLMYYLFIIFLGLLFRKKVIIFAQGIGPINTWIGQFLTKILLRQCTYVSVRDSKSFELLQKWGIEVELLCDPIFSSYIPPVEKTKTMAIQLRNCKDMNEDFIDRLAQVITNNYSDMLLEIFSFQDSIDAEVCQRFEKAVKLLNSDIKTKIYYGLTDEETIQKIASAQYLVAMRFHAIIVGLISKVKVLGINYDIKVEKLAKEFGIPLIELNKEFRNEFFELKSQNIDIIQEKLKLKVFDWNNFDLTINK